MSYFREYDIIDELGSGAFGTVYLVKLHADGDEVAMKKITKDKGDSDELFEEYNNFCYLSHPRLVSYFGYFESNKYYNLVMEYVSNGTLEVEIQQRWNNDDFWSEDELRTYFAQMISGVEYLHGNGFAHRDLKPDNILFDYNWNIKIADFGLTIFLDCTGYEYLYASKMGPKTYAAPELISNRSYGNNVDVWSLGVIFHEMCTLIHPFYNSYPTPNVDYLYGYSDDLNHLILECMLVRSKHDRCCIDDLPGHPAIETHY